MGKCKKPAVPAMLPRERLTAKARAAISKFASIKAGDLPIHGLMVDYVLEAERMRRRDLYAWLEARSYRWRAQVGFWSKL